MEYRMYFLVMRQLDGLNKGIQIGHCALEYVNAFGNSQEYKDFFENDKTFIILNGGTSNDMLEYYNYIKNEIAIPVSYFNEPDLNMSLSSVCFLVDERVWDKENYPDKDIWCPQNGYHCISYGVYIPGQPSPTSWGDGEQKWIDFIGGEQNVKLREFLKGKRLA